MARDFNGSSDITYTLASGQVGNTAESWSFWLYPDSVNQYKRPIHVGGTGSNRDRSFEMDNGWGFVFNFNFSSSGGAWSVSKPSTGSWQNYVVTFDGSSTSNDPIIYKDGVSQSVTERVGPSGTLRSSRTDLTIGSEVSSGQYWDGGIAEIAKWNRVLTAGEAAALGKGFAPAFFKNGLLLYLPLIGRISNEPDLRFGVTGSVDGGVTAIGHPRIIYPTPSQVRRYTTQATPPTSTFFPSRRMMRGIGI